MFELQKSDTFNDWLLNLRDRQARVRIVRRIEKLAEGNPGDVGAVGNGISELKFHFGPGYRVYFMQQGSIVIVLLCGGDKSSQQTDIAEAKRIASNWKE